MTCWNWLLQVQSFGIRICNVLEHSKVKVSSTVKRCLAFSFCGCMNTSTSQSRRVRQWACALSTIFFYCPLCQEKSVHLCVRNLSDLHKGSQGVKSLLTIFKLKFQHSLAALALLKHFQLNSTLTPQRLPMPKPRVWSGCVQAACTGQRNLNEIYCLQETRINKKDQKSI